MTLSLNPGFLAKNPTCIAGSQSTLNICNNDIPRLIKNSVSSNNIISVPVQKLQNRENQYLPEIYCSKDEILKRRDFNYFLDNLSKHVGCTIEKIHFETENGIEAIYVPYRDTQVKIIFKKTLLDVQEAALNQSYAGVWVVYSAIFRKMGFKLKGRDLYLPIYYNEKFIEDISISGSDYDVGRMIGVLVGYDLNYIPNMDRLVNMIQTSPYYCPSIFTDNEDNWVETSEVATVIKNKILNSDPSLPSTAKFDFSSGKAPWMTYLKRNFPDAVRTVQELLKDVYIKDKVSSKLNSDIIKEVTGIDSEVTIAKFKEDFKKSFPVISDYLSFINQASPTDIKLHVSNFHKGILPKLKRDYKQYTTKYRPTSVVITPQDLANGTLNYKGDQYNIETVFAATNKISLRMVRGRSPYGLYLREYSIYPPSFVTNYTNAPEISVQPTVTEG